MTNISVPLPCPTWARDFHGETEVYTADEMRAYAAECVAAERDCRLCANFTTASGGCVSVLRCVESDQFKKTTPHQYWAEKE